MLKAMLGEAARRVQRFISLHFLESLGGCLHIME